MWVFISEPSRKCPRVRTADCDPWVLGDTVDLVKFDLSKEIGCITEGLLGREQLHVANLKSIVSKGQRLSIESMFQNNHQSHSLLSKSKNPLPALRNAITNPLATQIQENRPSLRCKIRTIHMVSLLIVSSRLVIRVVDDLVKGVCLFVHFVDPLGWGCWLFDQFFAISALGAWK